MFDVQSVSITWRGAPVVTDVSFSVSAGKVVLLTGANGAGKSSLIFGLAGLAPINRGRVLWEGRDVTHLPLHARNGLAVVPEGRQLAASLSVEETLRLGAGRRHRPEYRHRINNILQRFPVLQSRLKQPAGTLSGGEAQMLSLARALMSAPRLLFLDEPTLGLSPAAAKATFDMLQALRTDGISMILTDQASDAASALADNTFVVSNHRLEPITDRHLTPHALEEPS